MAASVIPAVDQDVARAVGAHLAEGDFLRAKGIDLRCNLIAI